MNKRKLVALSLVCFTFVLALGSGRATSLDEQTPHSPTVDDGKALRAQAAAMKSAAIAQFERDRADCQQRFLANDCTESVSQRKSSAFAEASRLDKEGLSLNHQARRQEREARLKRKADEAPRIEAERQERSDKFYQEELNKELKRVDKQANEDTAAQRTKQSHRQAADSKPAHQPKNVKKRADDAGNRPESDVSVDRDRIYAERAQRAEARKQTHSEKLKARELQKAQQTSSAVIP